MALKLYRRHRKECEAGLPEDARTGEVEERRRGWKKCACLIHASGTLGGHFNRRQTGRFTWDEARAVAAAWEEAGSWDGKPEPPSPPLQEPVSSRITLDEATKVFLALREGDKIAPATLRKYKTFTKQLQAFAAARGYVMLDQLTSADIDRFYAGLKLGVRAKAKRLGTLRSFFRFCMNREWLEKNPVSKDLRPPLGANRVANKIPFTDSELERIINACDALGGVEWTNGDGEGAWTGEDAKDFIWTLTYTGLRISDVALFDMKRLQGNEVFLRAKKNGGDVFAYIPDWLRDRLVARSEMQGHMLFVVGPSRRLETVTNTWRRRLDRVFNLAEPFDEKPTPHRFRHTFARILLQRGVPVADVADLLGDDEATVREHYARWVPERQARLTKILKDAFEDKPRPKLVAIPGGRS
ncbi:MAG TPA: site-specific integrase [Terriglobia bacterium]|nr:site-specific integrase [Terriglobia bacterium]